MAINDNNWVANSDYAILKIIGAFIKNKRLEQNKTQSKLAEEAGINRANLSEIENGKPFNLLTLIQLLRALNQLYILEQFKVQQQISPLLLAKLEHSKRKRASKSSDMFSKEPR